MTLLVGLKLTSFSQKDTVIDSIPNEKCFTIPVVKLIMKDLLSGDSAKAVLELTEKQLIKCEEKTHYQDSIMTIQNKKIENLGGIIIDERTKYGILENHSKKLEKALGFEKFKNKCTLWVSGGAVILVTVVMSLIK